MSKKVIFIIIAVVLLIILALGGYFGFRSWGRYKASKENSPNNSDSVAEDITKSALQGVLPSIDTNPLQDKPDLNPVDKANPFKNVKTNPF